MLSLETRLPVLFVDKNKRIFEAVDSKKEKFFSQYVCVSGPANLY